jgi:hypothetical protein
VALEAGAADEFEHAARVAASASRPRVRVRRFMSVGLLSMLVVG